MQGLSVTDGALTDLIQATTSADTSTSGTYAVHYAVEDANYH